MKQVLKKHNFMRVIVIIGTMIIPLLYSYLYLGAFWDPYSKLSDLPVAVVNNDKGIEIEGEKRNIGEEICDSLDEDGSLDFVFTDEKSAKEGTEGDDYYAMIIIPEDFSEKIASATSEEKTEAEIIYSPNQKRNYLASQILNTALKTVEASARASVNSEIVEQLSEKLSSVPEQLEVLQSGLSQIETGSKDLNDGAGDLKEGTELFYDKFGDLKDGILKLSDGSEQLTTGASDLNAGINELLTGVKAVKDGSEKLSDLNTGAKELAAGVKALGQGISLYADGVDTLIANVEATQEFLTKYVTVINPEIMLDPYFSAFIQSMTSSGDDISKLKEGGITLKESAEKIIAGADLLAKGTDNIETLQMALVQVAEGLSAVEIGSEQLLAGSEALNSGIDELNIGAGQLFAAAGEIKEGASKLSVGSGQLYEGIVKATEGVDNSVKESKEELTKLDGLSNFAKAPVSITEDDIISVPNYGTAFAPYFLSLSLWVGALIVFMAIYYDPDNKFNILSRFSEHKVKRAFIFMGIGIIQAVVLGIVLKAGLGLETENTFSFFMACILVSLTFISIVQFFMVIFKDLGKFVSMVLLILQLTSCGGTFPMETVPGFFNALYKFMPMTYSVNLFKNVISGIDGKEVLANTLVLVILFVIFFGMTILYSIKNTGINIIDNEE